MASLKYVVIFSLIIMMLSYSFAYNPYNEDDHDSSGVVKRLPDEPVRESDNYRVPYKRSGTGPRGKGYFGG